MYRASIAEKAYNFMQNPPMFRDYLTTIVFLALCIIVSAPILAQDAVPDEPPLIGPLLAINTVQQDAIILYDVGADSYRRLSFGPQAHHVWDFSPDGCRLLFTLADGSEPAQLYTVALNGDDLRPMVTYAEPPYTAWGVWEPDWSPDGTRIAFTMIRESTTRAGDIEREHHIAWVDAIGGTPEFYSVTGREFSPTWSPDGVWLAYVSYDERAAGASVFATAVPTPQPAPGQTPQPLVFVNEADMWVVSADAATKYRLTNFSTGSIAHPRWSPDGELVAFVYSPSGNNDMFWMIANERGALPTQLSSQWSLILDTTWLPDGTNLVGAVRDFRDVAENRLWQIPLVGLADENATPYLPDANINHADYPRFSADGAWLAVRTAYEIALIDLETGNSRLLDPSTLGNSPVVWSPEGFNGEGACR